MKPVVLADEAELEALGASAFYTERSNKLGAEFTGEMERVLAVVEMHPEIGPVIEGELPRPGGRS